MADADGPSAKKMKFTGTFVTLKAGTGDSSRIFSVHEDMIKECSEFFRAAFDTKWEEGRSRQIELPEDEPEIVSMFLEWLYNEGAVLAWVPNRAETTIANTLFLQLSKLYIFAEKAQIKKLKEAVIVGIVECCAKPDENKINSFPVRKALDVIYRGTTSQSPARRLMVDLHVNFGRESWLRNTGNHPEFLQDLAITFFKSREQPRWTDTFLARAHGGEWFEK